ncbi:MAG TPA: Stp1/IreP family PP2C-type Ser/Thr phosphatase [Solirubrobacteraceae bacterium]|nr:Stp1/IreP family PP2C-type Ser/Thr phosphatase [Solirubrobacteraceae bacterium]
MLRIAEHFHDSDRGRQRRGNEDSVYVRSPLFVVADGMGGAQAGEVASAIAVQQFEGGLPDGDDPGAALAALIQAANVRIHEQARRDSEHAGMGTTTTAAYLAGDSVVIAHVGDSRCYLLRDEDLIRLTRDHSLVGELVARGKLTEEQAESHPQRSVITRALGAYPDVEVDVEAFPARAGDLFLLCSDGLTSMVHEPQLKSLLADRTRPLEQIGRELIAAANEAGGRDNITVILFRIEEVDDRRAAGPADDTARTAEYDTVADEAAESHAAPRTGAAVAEPESHRRGTVALEAPTQPAQPAGTGDPRPPPRTAPLPAAPERPRARRRSRLRSGGALLLFLAVLLPLIIGAWLATRAVYFIGTDPADGRTVTIFRGLPYELPFGVELYEQYYDSGVTLVGVPPARRASFTDHKLRSRDDAEDLVIALEKGQVE